MKTLKYLFLFEERVNRQSYILYGIALMAFKYLGEVVLYYYATNSFLNPFNFLSPLGGSRYPMYQFIEEFDWFLPAVVVWSAPFAWIGFSMSARRSADSGANPWWATLFFVPVVNFILILFLCLRKSVEFDENSVINVLERQKAPYNYLKLSFALSLVGFVLVWITVSGTGFYTGSLFMGGPFLVGCVIGILEPEAKKAYKSIYLTITLIHLLLLLFGLEGLICILMSYPLAIFCGAIGVSVAFGVRRIKPGFNYSPKVLFIMLPIFPLYDSVIFSENRDVVETKILIDQPPEVVWPNVIEFSELPKSKHWLFQLGVAHPLRARIEGRGVGAIRYCEFSTGAFVEPITAWEEPSRLAFDVKYQPEPMKELSFYDTVDAPHLDGYFRSKRGEFELVSQGDKTLLIGRTWYEVDMGPGFYWKLYGRWFIHSIHNRVLEHIKNLSEKGKFETAVLLKR